MYIMYFDFFAPIYPLLLPSHYFSDPHLWLSISKAHSFGVGLARDPHSFIGVIGMTIGLKLFAGAWGDSQ